MKKKYIAPQTEMAEVELENGFMKASVFEDEKQEKGLSTEEHGFATTGDWEGDYDGQGWD
ncbi:MAG TPA: hypothetical protein H9752_05745 [Candidatus Phocaeicola excrementigallinarum]|nr:hypothetical protein [Candidatus Phocaeicola excrementigallinarum]